MSLDYAILGFLAYKSFSGYDLKKVFDNSVRHFWPADQSQIYRTLARLTEEGWTHVEVIEQTDRPDRKVYHITEAGRAELRHWLAGPFPVQEGRSAPLIQIFFAGQLKDEEIIAKLEQAAGMFRAVLELYSRVPEVIHEYTEDFASAREGFFWGLTLELGIKTLQVQLEWAESIIERIKNKQYPS